MPSAAVNCNEDRRELVEVLVFDLKEFEGLLENHLTVRSSLFGDFALNGIVEADNSEFYVTECQAFRSPPGGNTPSTHMTQATCQATSTWRSYAPNSFHIDFITTLHCQRSAQACHIAFGKQRRHQKVLHVLSEGIPWDKGYNVAGVGVINPSQPKRPRTKLL